VRASGCGEGAAGENNNQKVVAELPTDKELHVILDNLNPHKKNEDRLAK
jgi:hypothetical protein